MLNDFYREVVVAEIGEQRVAASQFRQPSVKREIGRGGSQYEIVEQIGHEAETDDIFPYLTFEIWRFVQPALFDNEKKSVGLAFAFGTFMFFLGCAVGYFLVFPFTFRFLTEYQLSPLITNQISLTSYMGNFLMLIFVMGIVFELPLLAWLLSKLGLVTKTFFRKYRKHAVVVLLVLSAVITPTGDPFTLMIVFLPLYLLYELSIKIVRA